MASRPFGTGSAVALVALVLAALGGAETLGGLLLAVAVAWLALDVAVARGLKLPDATPRTALVVALLVAATPAWTLLRRAADLADAESLTGIDEELGDRLRLERSPAIHPALVATDRPQTFFVRADGAQRVRVTFAPGGTPAEGEALGHGVFRVDYEPNGPSERGLRGRASTDAIVEVDGAANVRTLRVSSPLAHPRWLRTSPDRTRACTTSEETGELLVVDAGGAPMRVGAGETPSDCAFVAGGLVAVSHRAGSDVALHRRDGRPWASIDVGPGGHRLAASADGALLAVARESSDGDVALVDVAARRVVARATLGGLPDWVAFDGDALVVARREPAALLRLERAGAALRVVAERALLAPAVTLAPVGGGARVVIAVTDWSDDARPHAGNHFVEDQLVVLDARTLAPERFVPTARRSPRQDAAGDVDRGVSPMGVWETPGGRWLVAFAGTDEVSLLDPAGGAPRSFDVARAGLSAPCSVVALADGTLVASSPSGGRVARLDPRTGAVRDAVALAPDDATLLRENEHALRERFGERAFYEGTRAGVSCQSCHLHGASDGMAHNIGGRSLAPTLDTRGLAGTAPYLRDGSYPRIGDLHEVAELRYRGWREPAGDRGATLDAWVSSLPLPRALAPRDLAAERRGVDAFFRAGCPTCHTPPAFTSLGRHPTATVFPRAHAAPGASLDTPSLRGVGRRTRWLFDGRARSLDAVLTVQNPDDRHGRTRGLSRRERADLVRFLESL